MLTRNEDTGRHCLMLTHMASGELYAHHEDENGNIYIPPGEWRLDTTIVIPEDLTLYLNGSLQGNANSSIIALMGDDTEDASRPKPQFDGKGQGLLPIFLDTKPIFLDTKT